MSGNNSIRLSLAALAVPALLLAAAPAAHAKISDDELPRLDEHTALTLGGQSLKLGVLAFDYGITDWLTVGTDPPSWAARAVLPILVPNLHAKLVAYRGYPWWFSVEAAGYWADLTNTDLSSGSLLVVPLTAFGSYYVRPDIGIHGEICYSIVDAFGSGNISNSEVAGAAAVRSVQLGLMGEYRLTRVVALTLRGRYQPYAGQLAFQASSSGDPFTQFQADARLALKDPHPYSVIAGAAFLWDHFRFTVGVGYGNYFIPGLNIAVPGKGFVPDASLYFVL
jgi:hypothetical protein